MATRVNRRPARHAGDRSRPCSPALDCADRTASRASASPQRTGVDHGSASTRWLRPRLHDNDLLQDSIAVTRRRTCWARAQPVRIYRARRGGAPVAAVIRPIAPDGYRGPIELLVAIAPDGRLIGVQVIRHNETPGLGDAFESRDVHWLDAIPRTIADGSAAAALDRAARRRRFRRVHRRHHHAARHRQGRAQRAGVLSAQQPANLRAARPNEQRAAHSVFGSTAQLIAVCPLLAMSDTVVGRARHRRDGADRRAARDRLARVAAHRA